MKFTDLLTTYWSQITLVFLAIGYFIKRIFDDKSKKLEITYSLFQQNRINAVNNFFSNYTKVEFLWNQLPIRDVLSHKITAKDLDLLIQPPINDLKRSIFELKIYFDQNAHNNFEQAIDNFLAINRTLMHQYFNYDSDVDINQKVNCFYDTKDKSLKANSIVIDKIAQLVRNTFNY